MIAKESNMRKMHIANSKDFCIVKHFVISVLNKNTNEIEEVKL